MESGRACQKFENQVMNKENYYWRSKISLPLMFVNMCTVRCALGRKTLLPALHILDTTARTSNTRVAVHTFALALMLSRMHVHSYARCAVTKYCNLCEGVRMSKSHLPLAAAY